MVDSGFRARQNHVFSSNLKGCRVSDQEILPDFRKVYKREDWYDLLEVVSQGRRQEVIRFIEKWCEPLGIWETPASTYHHGSFVGGLVDHMARVADIALHIQASVLFELNRESIALCGLLHDVSKLGWLTARGPVPRYMKNPKLDSLKPMDKGNQPFIYNPVNIDVSMTISGAAIVARWLTLSIEEWKAITFHDGQYVPENVAMFNSHQAEPLVLTLHYADMMALCIEQSRSFAERSNLVMFGPEGFPSWLSPQLPVVPPPKSHQTC